MNSILHFTYSPSFPPPPTITFTSIQFTPHTLSLTLTPTLSYIHTLSQLKFEIPSHLSPRRIYNRLEGKKRKRKRNGNGNRNMPHSLAQKLEAWITKRSYEVGFGDNGTFVGKKVLLQKILRDRFKSGFATITEEEIRLSLASLCAQGLAKRLNDEGAARARDLRDGEDRNGSVNGSTTYMNGSGPATAPTVTPAPPQPVGRDAPPVITASKSSSPDFFDAISEPVEARPLEPNPTDPSPILPYCVQHNITTSLQCILEGACFRFAKRHVPELLARKRWTCAHSAELSMWTKELSKTFEQSPSTVHLEQIGGTAQLPLLLKSLGDLRHSAVHRIPVPADKLLLFIRASLQMAEILGDEEKQLAVKSILCAVQSALDKQKAEKQKIEDSLSKQLQSIELQKKKLDMEAHQAKKQAEELANLLDDEMGVMISRELPGGIVSH
ncbi:unnamed protein product [Tuber aestivum]|uniref:Uncharacterized protein n=1 Tax=Tuber aestivum TaxID=59557 RepID=A0A292Q603_9PEZI|nr:unnamed protein product [Tuber aestivum]